MAYTNDPANSLVDRLRLKVGDTDEFDEGLTDETYLYLYDTTQNENRASLEALKMLVFHYAKYANEIVGRVETEDAQKYEHYKELLTLATKDPSFSFLQAGTAFAGGLNKFELNCPRSSNPFHLGEGSLANRTSLF